jgi:hypothetical protein
MRYTISAKSRKLAEDVLFINIESLLGRQTLGLGFLGFHDNFVDIVGKVESLRGHPQLKQRLRINWHHMGAHKGWVGQNSGILG